MERNVQDAYLQTQVMTATPQKLRLMLVDGAIRYASQTLEHWKENRDEEGAETLARCRAIIAELRYSWFPASVLTGM